MTTKVFNKCSYKKLIRDSRLGIDSQRERERERERERWGGGVK